MGSPKSILTSVVLAGAIGSTLAAGPHAVEVVRTQGPFGPAPYDDAAALLGPPATRFFDPFGPLSGGITNPRVKLVEAAFNVAVETNGLPTPNLLLTLDAGSEVIVRLDQPATNDPANPYGLDLLVFGNTFYTANGAANDNANLDNLQLGGRAFVEPLQVAVSPGHTGLPGESPEDPDTWPWYRYDTGPYADTVFPTHAFEWDRAAEEWTTNLMDFTKPVNPAFIAVIGAGGLTAADAIELYAGSGGGTGFDLTPSGFDAIRFVKVEGLAGFSGGEIDAFSAVRPRHVGEALALDPANVAGNSASLSFRWPTTPAVTQLRLEFLSIDRTALITTAAVTNDAAFPTLPGTPLNGVQVTLSPLPAGSNVSAVANVILSVGTEYGGGGADLAVFQSAGADWAAVPFTLDASTREVTAGPVGEFSIFVVVQLPAPTLTLHVDSGDVSVGFTSVSGRMHTIERSTDLLAWTPLSSFTATHSWAMLVQDPDPPEDGAFYRLKVNAP